MTLAIAVDLGGTKVEVCLVDADGTVLRDSRSRATTGADLSDSRLRRHLATLLAEAVRAAPTGSTIVGVGIGSAGPVDRRRGTVAPVNLPGVHDFPIVDAVRAALPPDRADTPVSLALDGQCIAVAEHWRGAGVGVQAMIGMVVSTGIGGGIVLDGRPIAGGTGNAGHIGQLEVAGFAGASDRGLPATVERIASGPNVVRWARERGWTGSSGEDLAADYRDGNAIAVTAVQRSAAAVGSAIASATALLDIDLVVIGGGFSHVSADYIDLVRAARDDVAAHPFLGRAEITRASLGADAPLIGAAALVLRR